MTQTLIRHYCREADSYVSNNPCPACGFKGTTEPIRNLDRARWVAAAIAAYQRHEEGALIFRSPEHLKETVTDLLTHLKHFADEAQLDLEDLWGTADDQYEAEVLEDNYDFCRHCDERIEKSHGMWFHAGSGDDRCPPFVPRAEPKS